MKRIILFAILVGFLAGCGQSAVQSELYQHKTLYRNWDHWKFSWGGYRHPTAEDVQKAKEQGWWGIDIPYVPGQ